MNSDREELLQSLSLYGLATDFEAIMGAVYIDYEKNLLTLEKVIRQLYA